MDYINTIYNLDCLSNAHLIPDQSIDLGIYDPPFGINESSYDKKHYKREKDFTIEGYQEAPEDPEEYYQFSYSWIKEAKRILKDNGSMYIISGWTHSHLIANAITNLDMHIKNKLIWKFNFGIYTKTKYVTSHYEIYYVTKSPSSKVTFNSYSRFGVDEKSIDNESFLYNDLRSVWDINKEYSPKEQKNKNKLPEELIKKMISYSSNKEDIVCDFFMGNFTTAICSKKLGRKWTGFEINKNAYDIGMKKLDIVKKDSEYDPPKKDNSPLNQGHPLIEEEVKVICLYYKNLIFEKNLSHKSAIKKTSKKFQRGEFSIKNIRDKYGKKYGIPSIKRTQLHSYIDLFEEENDKK